MKTNRIAIWMAFVAMLLAILPAGAQQQRSQAFKDKYKLQEAVVLSRHNIRAPLSDSKSDLGHMTPHEWQKWGAGKSELTSRGGALETLMGQYFRNWTVDAGLFPENYIPTTDDVNVQANSMQRCIATAQYFVSGFMPVGGVTVNHRFTPSQMDPLFNPQLTKAGPAFKAEALKQMSAAGGKKGMRGVNEALKPNYDLMDEVLDISESPMVKENSPKLAGLKNYDTEIVLEKWQEPHFKKGSALQDYNGASDALILQYYEQPDTLKATFGHSISREDVAKLAKIKGTYQDILFSAPIVAVNVSQPLIKYMFDELRAPKRKFTFLVGHDSNIGAVLAALGAEPYELPATIERHTPIGSKLVVEKFLGADGQEYADVNLVYQTVDQLRNMDLLNLDNPPMVYPISLSGLVRNADGLYKLADVEKRFEDTLAAYDKLD